MMELLYSGVVDRVAEKSAHIAEVDPNGFILTFVSVTVVFCVLLILYVIYALLGETFMAIYRKQDRVAAEEAAALSVALWDYLDDVDDADEAAAVAAALDKYISDEEKHDRESGVITIKR